MVLIIFRKTDIIVEICWIQYAVRVCTEEGKRGNITLQSQVNKIVDCQKIIKQKVLSSDHFSWKYATHLAVLEISEPLVAIITQYVQ